MSEFRRKLMMAKANQGGGDLPSGYIKDGLIFHLDCTDIDSSQSRPWVWKDRISGFECTLDVEVTQNQDKGIVFWGNPHSTGEFKNGFVATSKDMDTIEIAFISERKSSEFLLDDYATNSLSIIKMATNGIQFSEASSDIYKIGLGKNTISYCKDLIIFNKNKNISVIGRDFWGKQREHVTLGSRSNFNASFKGTIYSIRIYNRHLTEDEMLQNQQVDIDRFFGGVTPQ